MNVSEKVLLTGARDSKLSLWQTRQYIEKLCQLVPALKFEVTPMSSPGDRDRQTDLRVSDPDFFTRDLDDAVLEQKLDCAFHSAKDLPEKLRDGLDMLYLPWVEDQRDVLVFPSGRAVPAKPKIGVSSERREAFAMKKFPDGELRSIRGNIDNRVAQLDAGKYDVLIMAAAGLKRLGLADRISEYISLEELPPPPAQGWIAVTFRKGDPVFTVLRRLFVKPAVLAGAGIGSKANTTLGVIEALQSCDICLYDALCPHDLLDYLPDSATAVYVGKRQGEHSFKQSDICGMLVDYSRKNKKLVRLKGGDPGIFGRLAEETDIFDEFELPYTVLPGISSLNMATTATGLLLTRRGVNRGFTVATPRKSGSRALEWFTDEEFKDFTRVYFMGASEVEAISTNLLASGYTADLPVSVVYNAGSPDCQIISGSLWDIAAQLPETTMPGIILIGKAADAKFLYSNHGLLAGQRVMFAGSRNLTDKAEHAIGNFGGTALSMPMLELELQPDIEINRILDTDYLIVPSPSCAGLLLDLLNKKRIDLRRLPKLAVCGSGTAGIFEQKGIIPEEQAEKYFGAIGLIEALKKVLTGNERITRLCSDKAAATLSEAFAGMIEIEFYTNRPVHYDVMPECDWVMFTSPSSVEAFIDNFSVTPLSKLQVCAIGEPTRKKLEEYEITAIRPETATVEAMVEMIAIKQLDKQLRMIK